MTWLGRSLAHNAQARLTWAGLASFTNVQQSCRIPSSLHIQASRSRVRVFCTGSTVDSSAPAKAVKKVRLERLLSNLGYCTRKEAAEHVRRGRVTHLDGTRVPKASLPVDPTDILHSGEPLDPLPPYTIILNKPAGVTCSKKDPNAASLVYDLLPERYVQRDPILATVGRLDANTTGLLLMTDEGELLHRITSPKRSIWKVYEAVLAQDLSGSEAELFGSGTLVLESDDKPLAAAKLQVLGPRLARLAIQEGRYHQVRRMFAAAGNRVEELQRVSIGGLELEALQLEAGQWMPASPEHVAAVFEPLPDTHWVHAG